MQTGAPFFDASLTWISGYPTGAQSTVDRRTCVTPVSAPGAASYPRGRSPR